MPDTNKFKCEVYFNTSYLDTWELQQYLDKQENIGPGGWDLEVYII
jgi:hypothetical protein